MEADSTTYDSETLKSTENVSFPFTTGKCNLELYKSFVEDSEQKILEMQIVERLQAFGLLPSIIECLENKPTCKMICKTARVVDRVQWICEGCKKRQPIRFGSFFLKLQCSLIQALQMILAWCEDADIYVAAEYFDVKPRIAKMIYDKLDDLAIAEINSTKLGGEDTVVLAEMYPECLNRLSPDTTDQPHVHPILMLADTKHIPTHYKLHVMKEHLKRVTKSGLEGYTPSEVESTVGDTIEPGSMLVSGHTVPPLDGAYSMSHLAQHCDIDMQRFLTNRIWSQAVTLCSASRDLCSGAPTPHCAAVVQRYLDVSLYRLRHSDGFYQHILSVIADKFTDKTDVKREE